VVTYAQLEDEPWWGREIVTSALTGAGLMLCSAYGVAASAFGTKGNNRHLNGSHRSQEWIKNSAYVDPPGSTYTVQSGLTAEQARFIAGLDFTPGAWGSSDNRSKMIAITNRLDAAYARGDLNGIVRQFFGTKNGTTVFGRDVPTGRIISADDSHLDHSHVGVNRAVADDNDAMAKIARIMIGDTMTTDDVIVGTSQLWDKAANRSDATGRNFANDVYEVVSAALGDEFGALGTAMAAGFAQLAGALSAQQSTIDRIEAKLDQALAAGGAPVPLAVSLSGSVSAVPGSVSMSGTATPVVSE